MRTYQVIVETYGTDGGSGSRRNVITLPFVSILKDDVREVEFQPCSKVPRPKRIPGLQKTHLTTMRHSLEVYDRLQGSTSGAASERRALRVGRKVWGDAIQTVEDVRTRLAELPGGNP